MKAFLSCVAMVALSLIFLSAFANNPKMKEVEVIIIAKKAVVKAGYKIEEFKEPTVRFESTEKDRTWMVLFVEKVNPLRSFLVLVNDETGETEIMPGE
jgi:hypothetical protein